VPAPLEYGFVETLIGKLATPLPAALPLKLTYADVDSPTQPCPRGRVTGHRARLKTVQWIVLARRPRASLFAGPPIRRRLAALLLALGVVLLALMRGCVVQPASDRAGRAARTGRDGVDTRADTAMMPPHQAALVRRGAYLFTMTSCAFCHGNELGGQQDQLEAVRHALHAQYLLGPRGRIGAGATPRWPAPSAAGPPATGGSCTGRA